MVIVSKGNKGGLGRTYVMKGDECKFILKEELQSYLDDGWVKMRITRPLKNTICINYSRRIQGNGYVYLNPFISEKNRKDNQ